MAQLMIPLGVFLLAVRCVTVVLFLSVVREAAGSTQVGFYDSSCPDVESIVRSTVQDHAQSDVTIPAGLLRLHFHDCFIQGCDGSILIDGPAAEKTALANLGLRGFEVIEDAKSRLEAVCPEVVSCADILALAARDAVDMSGGPSWDVPLGRRDGQVSSASDAADMPAPIDSVSVLKQKFASKGLSTQDLAILNGAHTLGQSECRFFSYRLYNYSSTGQPDPTINSEFLSTLQALCPPGGDGTLKIALDIGSQTDFDLSFFRNVLRGYGVLESDQRIASDSSTSTYVRTYAGLLTGLLGISYNMDFTNSMIKLSNIGVKAGAEGEIRKVCSSFN